MRLGVGVHKDVDLCKMLNGLRSDCCEVGR
jgi:hypothetical protein